LNSDQRETAETLQAEVALHAVVEFQPKGQA